MVWFSYHIEGVRAKGLFGYLKSFLPAGLEDMNPIGKALIFVIELLSHFMRLVSLSVRLFANILAGHLLLLFMGGGLAVLLGLAALGALTFPLAFVFFILGGGADRNASGVHLRHPLSHLHRRRSRRNALERSSCD